MDSVHPHYQILNSSWWQFLCILCCLVMLMRCDHHLKNDGSQLQLHRTENNNNKVNYDILFYNGS